MFKDINFTIAYENSTQRFFVGNLFYNFYLTKDKAKARLLKSHLQKESLQNIFQNDYVTFVKIFRKLSYNKLDAYLETL